MTSVVIGVGNPYRGDDGVGPAVAERLRGRMPEGVEVLECEQEPSRLLDAWAGSGAAVVVDAAASGARAGTVHRFDAHEECLPAGFFRSSTHAFGVGDAVELGRALGRLPGRLVVYAVEGASFAAGTELSRAVAEAVPQVADAVLRELEEGGCTSAG